jgi:hypothetical protein
MEKIVSLIWLAIVSTVTTKSTSQVSPNLKCTKLSANAKHPLNNMQISSSAVEKWQRAKCKRPAIKLMNTLNQSIKLVSLTHPLSKTPLIPNIEEVGLLHTSGKVCSSLSGEKTQMKLVTMKRLYARLGMLPSACQMDLQCTNVYRNSRSTQGKSHSIRAKLIGPRLKQWL